jgi:DNA polymerase III subunit chi
MARADFYILNGNTTAARFSCSIASKAWSQGHSIYIMARNTEQAAKIDDLLWTYHDISFLPHARIDNEGSNAPVIIGWPGVEPAESDVMINLTETVPDCAKQYQRVIEIIAEDPLLRNQGRQRYKAYRDMGYEMFNHEINMEQ